MRRWHRGGRAAGEHPDVGCAKAFLWTAAYIFGSVAVGLLAGAGAVLGLRWVVSALGAAW